MRHIKIFDTTLRDGEQVPGAKINTIAKIKIAQQLKKLGVDIIEAGFSASSPGDFKAVKAIAKMVKGPAITALARAVKNDIDAVYNSVKYSDRPRIHIVLGASDIHIKNKLKTTREECLKIGVEAVRYAKTLLPDVEYSIEDFSRSDFKFICRIIREIIKSGATVINIADTVGYAIPEEFGDTVKRIRQAVPEIEKVDKRFVKIADQKKEVCDDDLCYIVKEFIEKN